MTRRALQNLGRVVRERRGEKRLRDAAKEIGISPPTLMRVENGRVPDVGTFMKLCNWLNISPAEFGYTGAADSSDNPNTVGVAKVAVHFKGDKTPKEPTARALANMI